MEAGGSHGIGFAVALQAQMKFACVERLKDEYCLSDIGPNRRDRLKRPHDVDRRLPVRVIEYRINGSDSPELWYRSVTTIPYPLKAHALEPAELWHERWEMENTLDELKIHLRGSQVVLRSKTPDLVRREFYGFPMLHFAVRSFMHEAAVSVNRDPDELSFIHAV